MSKYNNHTSKELSEKYQINESTIKGIWRRNGCNNKTKFLPDKKEFIEKYNSLNIKDVAAFYGKDRHTIICFAKRMGIYKKKEPILTLQQEKEICELYNKASSTVLAKKYNVSVSKIGQVWANAGLKGKTNRTYYLNEDFFENIDCDKKAYWLGFIAADGCLHDYKKDARQDTLSFNLSIDDEQHLKKFKKDIETEKPLIYSTRNNFSYVGIQISSNKLSHDIQKLGIGYRKTYNILWPSIPDERYPAYIRGYFDGDDCISKALQEDKLHQTNIGIAGFQHNLFFFQQFLLSRGIKPVFSIDKRKGKYKHTQKAFGNLTFTNKKEKLKFLHLIYDDATVYLERKYELAQLFFDLCEKTPKTWEIKK